VKEASQIRNKPTSQESKDAFYQKIRRDFRLDDFIAKADQFNQEFNNLQRHYKQELTLLNEKAEKDIPKLKTS
jgi:hypothetical protein